MSIDSNSTRASIKALLAPASIAIAGASADPGKLGSLPLSFLLKHGYAGKIYPIHPKLEEISSIRCYRSVSEIEGEVDLLVIALAAARISALIDECRPGQVKAALVLSSGFAELGPAGAELQAGLAAKAAAKGIRFIGPNSVGIANLWDKVIPSISQVFDQADLAPGPIGFVSQSGAVGTAITALAHREQIGIGYFVSTGNEGDLEFSDFCDYFAADPKVRIIAGYVESIRDGERFRRAAEKAAAAGKPVILIKVGTSEAGVRAVRSHTGALAGSEEVYRAAFSQLGVVRAQSIEELIDLLKVFAVFPAAKLAPGSKGRAAILSHSGGAGVLMADTCIAEGLDVATPSESLVEALKKRLPPFASFQNPIDMTAGVIFDPELMANTLRDVVDSREYDAVMLCVNLIWRQGSGLAEQLGRLAEVKDALIGVAWIAGRQEPLDALNRSGVPVFSDPVRCARAIAARLRWEVNRETVVADFAAAGTAAKTAPRDSPDRYLAQEAMLRDYGIDTAPAALCRNFEEAREAAARLGYPVAAKLAALGLAHKSELGGVYLGIASDERLKQVCGLLDKIDVEDREGILVQKMVAAPMEVFVGMHRDEVFGPVVVIGLGGVYVEIIKDTILRLAPFDAAHAERLIRGARFAPLLDGARGRPRLDIAALARIVSAVSALAMAEPEVTSLDLNPVMLDESGAQVVDFKFECEAAPRA
jgi:acetate---CoA ligase (ADP-forming)